MVDAIFLHNKFKIKKGNHIIRGNAHFSSCQIICIGQNNIIEVGRGAVLEKCEIRVYGDNCRVIIGSNVKLNSAVFWLEEIGSAIIIGDETTVHVKTEFSAIEGKIIKIGIDCMFSSNIKLMTGDAHSILDSEGKRVNYSNDIVVEDHVWLCTQTMVLKGAHIPANSIVGAYSLVT